MKSQNKYENRPHMKSALQMLIPWTYIKMLINYKYKSLSFSCFLVLINGRESCLYFDQGIFFAQCTLANTSRMSSSNIHLIVGTRVIWNVNMNCVLWCHISKMAQPYIYIYCTVMETYLILLTHLNVHSVLSTR